MTSLHRDDERISCDPRPAPKVSVPASGWKSDAGDGRCALTAW